MTTESPVASVAKPGKYLSFVLGGEEYGVEILKVQEINGITETTRVPRTPEALAPGTAEPAVRSSRGNRPRRRRLRRPRFDCGEGGASRRRRRAGIGYTTGADSDRSDSPRSVPGSRDRDPARRIA